MAWEQVTKHPGYGNHPNWWTDPNCPGIKVSKTYIIPNAAFRDLLQLKDGSAVLVMVDKKNGLVGFRNARSEELQGAYVICGSKNREVSHRSMELRCSKRIRDSFAWFMSGTYWKATVQHDMMVVENKL